MFKYIEFYQGGLPGGYYHVRLIDTEFTCGLGVISSRYNLNRTDLIILLVQEYNRRKLNAGKNLALATLWWEKEFNSKKITFVDWQNYDLPKYVDNWKKVIAERDKYFQMLKIWK